VLKQTSPQSIILSIWLAEENTAENAWISALKAITIKTFRMIKDLLLQIFQRIDYQLNESDLCGNNKRSANVSNIILCRII